MSTDERDGDRADDHAREPVGSVAEEAAKLFGALGDALADRTGGDLGAGVSGLAGHAARTFRDLDDRLGDHLGDHLATGAPECTYCPLCRTVHVIRQTSPEVRAHLATAASALAQAASGWLATVVPEQSGERSPGVAHIDLDTDLDTDVDTDTDPEEDGR